MGCILLDAEACQHGERNYDRCQFSKLTHEATCERTHVMQTLHSALAQKITGLPNKPLN